MQQTKEVLAERRADKEEEVEGRVYFLVGPVVAWSCLCLVKLCGTHLTSAFSVSGIHCYNYAIMSLYSLRSDCTTPPLPPSFLRSGKMLQLDALLFFFSFQPATLLMCFMFLILPVCHAGPMHLIFIMLFVLFISLFELVELDIFFPPFWTFSIVFNAINSHPVFLPFRERLSCMCLHHFPWCSVLCPRVSEVLL